VIADFRASAESAGDKPIYRALNRAMEQTATGSSREIRKVYNLKHRALLAAMTKRLASSASLTATIEVRGKPIPLIEFDARWTRATRIGASVRVKVGGPRKRIRGAFIGVHGYTGARQVFVRKELSDPRSEIKSLRSISIPQAFAARAVIKVIKQIASESFSKNYAQQLKFMKHERL
jgi:hypothetical protein